MKLLLDTHFLYWMASNPGVIAPVELDAISDPKHALFASAISFMELRIKWQARNRAGDRKRDVDPQQVLRYVERNPITLLELSAGDCATSLDAPLGHRDPFDEQLLIHAQRLGAKLLTRDRLLAHHPLAYRVA